jgi:hypothetical protein
MGLIRGGGGSFLYSFCMQHQVIRTRFGLQHHVVRTMCCEENLDMGLMRGGGGSFLYSFCMQHQVIRTRFGLQHHVVRTMCCEENLDMGLARWGGFCAALPPAPRAAPISSSRRSGNSRVTRRTYASLGGGSRA